MNEGKLMSTMRGESEMIIESVNVGNTKETILFHEPIKAVPPNVGYVSDLIIETLLGECQWKCQAYDVYDGNNKLVYAPYQMFRQSGTKVEIYFLPDNGLLVIENGERCVVAIPSNLNTHAVRTVKALFSAVSNQKTSTK